MKTIKNKIVAMILSILIIAILGSTSLLANTSAHTPAWQIQSIAFLNVSPNPIGIGQSATISFGLTAPPPTANGPYGDRYTNLMVKVTKPDGTTQTLGPFSSDDTGGTNTQFVPTAIGTYSFQMTYPGQTLLAPTGSNSLTFAGDYQEPATSAVVTLSVQQQPVGGVSVAPLPTSYWQTPVNAMNVNNWYAIAGAALETGNRGGTAAQMFNQSGNYNPYTTAPMTAHIIWTRPTAFGGVLGGQFGGTTTYGNYYSTRQYEHLYSPIIMNGYLYYTQYPGSSTTPTANVCINLYTGQTVWTDDGQNYGGGSPQQTALTTAGIVTPLKCGQILDYVSPNQYGGLAYLWTTGTPAGIVSAGTTWNMFDALTGTYILSIVNGTSMTLTVDSGGNLIGYYVNATAGKESVMGNINDNTGPTPTIVTNTGPTLNEWNSTECVMAGGWSATAAGWEWRPTQNGIIPFSDGLHYSAPIATSISGNNLPSTMAIWSVNSGVIILDAEAPGFSGFQGGWIAFAGYSTTTGQQLWIENVTITPFTYTSLDTSFIAGSGVFTTITKETGVVAGYSMYTGKLLWSDTLTGSNGAAPDAWDQVGGYQGVVANGTLILDATGGDVWSINMLSGKINWYTNTTIIQGPAETNTPYGIWPIWEQCDIGVADGVVFLAEGHEYSPPLFLGAEQLAVNETNGKLIWSIDAFNVDCWPVTAYGVMTTCNAYDNQIYAYAMGPSKTTISAPQIGITTATPITLTGTVTDTSAGSTQSAVAANFPNGLPCVSDASMSQFMEAVYMQQPMPSNITGVPVTFTVLDSNGNYRTIGATTTDALGTYSFTWKPDISGNYTVYALFGGTQAYYGSSASTGFFAGSPSTQSTSTPAPVASNVATMTDFTLGIAAIIIAIVIVGALTIVMQRKRPIA
ncbi:MAG: PQQ-binding-like beta-propeller repeat protein [Candidatus Bathyarchaeia archaeon]